MRRQRGVALLALLAVILMAASWMFITQLNATSNQAVVVNRVNNAAVLNQAKRTLIGYVANVAARSTENNPGRLPCPEPAAYVGSANPNEGEAAGNCTLPAVGRLPWKTLGLEKLVDAAGEPLWYVVSPAWALTNSTVPPLTTYINSNSVGQLTVDGVANDAVALIIAPGQAMSVQAAAGCTARNQARATPSPAINPLDYLECYNTATASFTRIGPTASFNDQVVTLSAAEVLPAIEASIADRFERQIAPGLRSAYSSAAWGGTTLLPYALSFANPAGAASYAPGVTHGTQGILPLSYSETAPNSGTPCTPSAADPRCQPLFVAFTGGTLSGPSILSPSCTVVTGTTTQLDCTFYYTCALLLCVPPTLNFTIQAQAANVGASLRQINLAAPIGGTVTATLTPSPPAPPPGALDAAGGATLTLTGTATPNGSGGFLSALLGNLFCGLPIISLVLGCQQDLISVPIGVLADHPIVDVSNATYGWFLRNKWHEVSYYAVAPGIAPGGGGACATSISCLGVTYHPSDGKQRGLILIAGRALGGQARPPAAVGDLLEGANADGVSPFELRSAALQINRGFNDRVAVIDSN